MGELVVGALVFLVAMGLLGLIVAGEQWLPARRAKKEAAVEFQGEWSIEEKTSSSALIVGLRRSVNGQQTAWAEVGRVRHDAPDWTEKLRTLRAEAELRQAQLEARR